MKLTLGFSPCPNDTFMFDALVNKKVDTEELEFEVILEDVETLNLMALERKLDVTKLSFNAFLRACSDYILLQSGSALGKNCGPLVISKAHHSLDSKSKVAIPGKYTTANSLFQLAFPNCKNTTEIIFSEIEDAVLNERVDAGVIIHENRFTYEQKGLQKVMDLGEYWESETGLPIPLGGIAVLRTFNTDIQQKVQRVLKRSIEYAFQNPKSSEDYVCKYAQEMSYDIMKKHIELYVNEYSVNLGVNGREAIEYLFQKNNVSTENLFVGL
ncbi:1,4-dihydroxy-6-naphthoate synthase [bacterium]|mgnify:FL=1|nr:1,4-dihydroxy-6-naphthoate synthase [bacterium]